jgi:hypothetical protein
MVPAVIEKLLTERIWEAEAEMTASGFCGLTTIHHGAKDLWITQYTSH